MNKNELELRSIGKSNSASYHEEDDETQNGSVYHQQPDDHNAADEDLQVDDFESQQTQLPQFKRHFGNNLVLIFCRGEPLITIGPHWPLNFCMVGCFGIASYFLLFHIAPMKHSIWLQKACWAVAFLQMITYCLCALRNPGIVTARHPEPNSASLQCIVCRVPRSAGPLYHCEDCDVCIRGYDHHCPWTGKCIGEGNICFFYAFITMIPVYFIFFMIVTVA